METSRSPERGKRYVAKDQMGNVWWLGKHPRKELLEKLDRAKAHKMYLDIAPKDKPKWIAHVGYVIGPHWIDVWEIAPAFEPDLELA